MSAAGRKKKTRGGGIGWLKGDRRPFPREKQEERKKETGVNVRAERKRGRK